MNRCVATASIAFLMFGICCQPARSADDAEPTTLTVSVSKVDGKPRLKIECGQHQLFTETAVLMQGAANRTELQIEEEQVGILKNGVRTRAASLDVNLWQDPALKRRKLDMIWFKVKPVNGTSRLRLIVGDIQVLAEEFVVQHDQAQARISRQGNSVRCVSTTRDVVAGDVGVNLATTKFSYLNSAEVRFGRN